MQDQGINSESTNDAELAAASGGAGEAGMVCAAVDAGKRIINGLTADDNPHPDIKIFTKDEWESSSSMYRHAVRTQGSSSYGGDPTKQYFKVVDSIESKKNEVDAIKAANNGISKENPGW